MRTALPSTILALAAVCGGAQAQDATFDLSVDNIMRGPDVVGRSPTGFRWTPDSRHLYFTWHQAGVDTTAVTYRVRADGSDLTRLPEVDLDTVLAGPAEWYDRDRAVFSRRGDLVLWDDGAVRQLTHTTARESGPQWSADGRTLYFRSGTNLFALALAAAELRQLTDIRTGDAPSDPAPPEGQRAFLIEQQRRLFDFIDSEEFESQPWNRSSTSDSTRPQPFYVGEGKRVAGMRATPDGRFVLLTVVEPARRARRIEMPLWITDDGYLDTYRGRSKVGDAQGRSRAAVLEVATGAVTFVGDSVGEGDRDITGVDVSPTSAHALVRVESADREHRWYATVDLPSLSTRVVAHDHDTAWLTSPGPGLSRVAGFVPDGGAVYFGSERSGWAHLYRVAVGGGEPTALTEGSWEVLAARLTPDRRHFLLTANREGYADAHAYTVPVSGGTVTRLTSAPGRQNATVSPDGRWLALRHSPANRPWELALQRNRANTEMRLVTESRSEEFRRHPWIVPEIVEIPARDGTRVPGRLYRPTGGASETDGARPAVIFVHGAGYLQNVHNWWSGYFREYMFHHLLAARGYTVLDLDYRGSAGHGRDWRTAIYRHMGGKDLTDQVDGAAWLVDSLGIDSTRIGIYGGSYGGFITLMAMFTTPGVFQAGAALRPVTDWAHYNHGYTASILNEPHEDTLAYVRSSPIYHAEGLEGHLLMAHGMVDENVLFYDTARLAQRLIELRKENWEVALYPAERHGFRRASSWADEYRRILKLFETTLRR